MLRMHDLSNLNFDEKEPWADIISQCAWAIHATVHTTLDATPGQLVFGRDMLFDLSLQADWKNIYEKQKQAHKNSTACKNAEKVKYTYGQKDHVLLDRGIIQHKLNPKRDGPYKVKKVYTNGAVKIHKGIVSQTVSLSRLKPYNIRSQNTH